MSDLAIFLFGAGVTLIVGTAMSTLIIAKNRREDLIAEQSLQAKPAPALDRVRP